MLASGYPCLQRITGRLCALPVDSGSPELQGAHSGVQLQSQSLNEFPPFTENEISQKATRRGKWAQGNPAVAAVYSQPSLLWFVFMKTLRKKWRRYDCSSNCCTLQSSVPSSTHSEDNQSSDADWILPVKCK